MKLQALSLLLAIAAAAGIANSRNLFSKVSQLEPPSLSRPKETKGLSIGGFRPGMRAQDILNENPEMFQILTERLQSQNLSLMLDSEDKVRAVEALQGAVVEKDGEPLFAYSDGYNKAKEAVSTIPGAVVLQSSIHTTDVELGSQVIRLVHRYHTGPLGNKGLLASVVLLDSKN